MIGDRPWERRGNTAGIAVDDTGARNSSNHVGVKVGSGDPGLAFGQGDGPSEDSTALRQSLAVGLSIHHYNEARSEEEWCREEWFSHARISATQNLDTTVAQVRNGPAAAGQREGSGSRVTRHGRARYVE